MAKLALKTARSHVAPQKIVPKIPIHPTNRSHSPLAYERRQALNPPNTARPPPLSLPGREKSQVFYRYYYKLGKAYLLFYKEGLKGVVANYKIARQISNYPHHPLLASRRTLYAAANGNTLTRAQFQLLLRLRADAKVLPMFALVFLCCGEFTPLLVPFLTSIVPPTLHIPIQTRKLRAKAHLSREKARKQGPVAWRSIHNIWGLAIANEKDDKTLQAIVRRLAQELALHPSWWEKIPSTKLYMMMVRRRLGKRLTELEYDDLRISRDGGVSLLSMEELVLACDKRGFTVERKSVEELRSMLRQWGRDKNSKEAVDLIERLQVGKFNWDGNTMRQMMKQRQ